MRKNRKIRECSELCSTEEWKTVFFYFLKKEHCASVKKGKISEKT